MRPVKYIISGTLEDHDAVYLEFRGKGWAIEKNSMCLNRKNEWEWIPMPSSRDDNFFKRCRWSTAEIAYKFFLKNAKKD